MTTSQQILERVKRTLDPPTKYHLAKTLHMSPSNLNRVLSGKGHLGEEATLIACERLSTSYESLRTMINKEAARSDRERDFWRSRSPRISAAGAVAALALYTAGSLTSAKALILDRNPVLTLTTYTLCEVRKWIRAFGKRTRLTPLPV
jgi:hypothetical protein